MQTTMEGRGSYPSLFFKMLKSIYPIICAPMNSVYSYEMLETCVDCGITPGVFIDQIPQDDLCRFVKEYGGGLYVTLSTNRGNDTESQKYYIKQAKLLKELGIQYVEITRRRDANTPYDPITNIIRFLKQDSDVTIISKGIILELNEHVDAITIKGNEAAGHSGELSTSDMFGKIRSQYPEKKLIASGGIHCGEQVRDYVDRGAAAVSLGTMFACSTESPLSLETKHKLINATVQDLGKFNNTGQQGLIFSKVADDPYHIHSLELGVQTGSSGHVYAGHAVDHITEILPIHEIVKKLIHFL
jgi:2-keto-3-deoxy-6-phosphogluconate aldolase